MGSWDGDGCVDGWVRGVSGVMGHGNAESKVKRRAGLGATHLPRLEPQRRELPRLGLVTLRPRVIGHVLHRLVLRILLLLVLVPGLVTLLVVHLLRVPQLLLLLPLLTVPVLPLGDILRIRAPRAASRGRTRTYRRGESRDRSVCAAMRAPGTPCCAAREPFVLRELDVRRGQASK